MQRTASYFRTPQIGGASPRETEILAFGLCNDRLTRAATPRERIEALGKTQQLWSLLVQDLGAEGNRLPDELKQNLLRLGFWAMALCHQGNAAESAAAAADRAAPRHDRGSARASPSAGAPPRPSGLVRPRRSPPDPRPAEPRRPIPPSARNAASARRRLPCTLSNGHVGHSIPRATFCVPGSRRPLQPLARPRAEPWRFLHPAVGGRSAADGRPGWRCWRWPPCAVAPVPAWRAWPGRRRRFAPLHAADGAAIGVQLLRRGNGGGDLAGRRRATA